MRNVAFLFTGLCAGVSFAQEQVLEEIVVTADFRGAASAELPLSVSVLNSDTLEIAGVQHPALVNSLWNIHCGSPVVRDIACSFGPHG